MAKYYIMLAMRMRRIKPKLNLKPCQTMDKSIVGTMSVVKRDGEDGDGPIDVEISKDDMTVLYTLHQE
jgi:hypothetical protein